MASVAQIPNGGFETLNGWFIGSASLSTDHYPVSVGSYSVKLENHLPLANNQSYGYAVTGTTNSGCVPSFAISGHPGSLCGYYKCFPLDGDTMQIGLELFSHGVWVGGCQLLQVDTVAAWTSFSIPIPAYATADSATITVAAFYNDTTCGMPAGPFGNSVMYVDNLSFDNLITSISETGSTAAGLTIYLNPASDMITVRYDGANAGAATMDIYSVTGALVRSQKLTARQIDVSDLDSGVYIVSCHAGSHVSYQKLLMQR